MKRIAILAVMLAAMMSASATSVLYFTRSQADRAVSYLNRQDELIIYCGYDYEIETYVLLNEVWAERVNSSYYELWIYGYDAYTGEEIYMPIDLQCIWLYRAGNVYNAAQYLRFRTSSHLHRPAHVWSVPAYNHYTRVVHRPGYTRTYHYDVHRHGWMPPTQHHSGPAVHPYYRRSPQTPPPTSHGSWTPGVDRPHVTVEHPSQAGSSSGARPTPTHPSQQPATTPTTPSTPRNGNSAAPSRSSSTQSSAPSRSSSTQSSAPSRSSSTQTSAPSRNTETKPAAPSRSSETKPAAPSRNTETKPAAPTRNTETKPKEEAKQIAPSRSNNTQSKAPSRSR